MNEPVHIPIVVAWRLVDDPCARQPSHDYMIPEYTSKALLKRQLFPPRISPLDTFVSISPYILIAAFSHPYPF
jgi:hypothetical protein